MGSDEESSGCPVGKEKNDIYNPLHVCIKEKATEEKAIEEMEDEPSGPNYDRVKREESPQDMEKGGERGMEEKKGENPFDPSDEM